MNFRRRHRTMWFRRLPGEETSTPINLEHAIFLTYEYILISHPALLLMPSSSVFCMEASLHRLNRLLRPFSLPS